MQPPLDQNFKPSCFYCVSSVTEQLNSSNAELFQNKVFQSMTPIVAVVVSLSASFYDLLTSKKKDV